MSLLPVGLTFDAKKPAFPIPENPLQLREELEKKFNIQIRTRKQIPLNEREFPPEYGGFGPEPEWDTGRLHLLEKCLSVLPSYFYQQNHEGKKFQFILSNGSHGQDFAQKHGMILSNRDFTSQTRKEGFIVVTHEFIHTIIPLDSQSIYPSTIAPEWSSSIVDILGRGLVLKNGDDFPEKVKEKWRQTVASKIQSSLGNPDKEIFYRRFYKGAENLNEFLAVLGENYVQGKSRFLEGYGEFFGEKTAQELYDFAKKKMFTDKDTNRVYEYEKNPIQE